MLTLAEIVFSDFLQMSEIRTKHQTLKHQTPNTEHQTPNTKHQTPNTKHQTLNTKHQTPVK